MTLPPTLPPPLPATFHRFHPAFHLSPLIPPSVVEGPRGRWKPTGPSPTVSKKLAGWMRGRRRIEGGKEHGI